MAKKETTIRVRAKRPGIYAEKRREEGETFPLAKSGDLAPWMEKIASLSDLISDANEARKAATLAEAAADAADAKVKEAGPDDVEALTAEAAAARQTSDALAEAAAVAEAAALAARG